MDSYPLLQYLDLSFSHIDHIEDDALGRLEILEILMLDNNNLKKIPLSLPVSLEHLFLQNNNIMEIQAQSFQGLTSLKTLDLSHNKLLYLPDIALPKLQTLNLQSAEIRGISQGIVHTLPRLNELMLEDNPIKCSDLLGIAEWASTCRLRTGIKEEMLDNTEEQSEEDSPEASPRRGDIKKKYMKMYNFYEKFEGVECQQNLSLHKLQLPQPVCSSANMPADTQAKSHYGQELKATGNVLKGFSSTTSSSSPRRVKQTEVENFNLDSIMAAAIPLPSKKAGKTSMEQQQQQQRNKTAAIVDVAAEAITTVMPKTAITELTPLTETLRSTKEISPHFLGRNPSLVSKDKMPEHSKSSTIEMKEFQDTPKEGGFIDGVNRSKMVTKSPARIGNISRSNSNVEGVQQTLKKESLRAVNLAETLKENVPGTIIKNDDNKKKEIQKLPEEDVVPDSRTLATRLSSTTADTTGPTKPETVTAAVATSTTSPQPATQVVEVSAKNKIEEFKNVILPTAEIKAFDSSTIMASNLSTKWFSHPAATLTTMKPLKSPTNIKDISADTTTTTITSNSNTELYDFTTTSSNIKKIATTPGTLGIGLEFPVTTLMSTASKQQQGTTTTDGITTSRTTTNKDIKAVTSREALPDKDLASNYNDNSHNNNKDESNSDKDNDRAYVHTTNNGQGNKTLVTLNITTTRTPITPKVEEPMTPADIAKAQTQGKVKVPNQTLHKQQQHLQQQHTLTATIEQQHPSVTTTSTSRAAVPLERNDVNVDCIQSKSDGK